MNALNLFQLELYAFGCDIRSRIHIPYEGQIVFSVSNLIISCSILDHWCLRYWCPNIQKETALNRCLVEASGKFCLLSIGFGWLNQEFGFRYWVVTWNLWKNKCSTEWKLIGRDWLFIPNTLDEQMQLTLALPIRTIRIITLRIFFLPI